MKLRIHRPEDDDQEDAPPFLPFDLFVCWGTDKVSRFISAVTSWPFGPPRLRIGPAHVAFCVDWYNHPLWAESTGICKHPCLYHNAVISGCQFHNIADRIEDYVKIGGRVDVYRLAPMWQLKADQTRELLSVVCNEYVGKEVGYDLDGAMFSALRVWKLLDVVLGVFPNADTNQLFCSEWAAHLLMYFNRLPLSNCSKFTPAELARAMVNNGVSKYERSFQTAADVAQLKTLFPKRISA